MTELPSIAVLEREDVALFIDAASTCTGVDEFYGDAGSQRVSLDFLHRYVLGNYRRLYALCLGAGVNHFNQAEIVGRLLASGAPKEPSTRTLEGRLIRGALRELPPQRVYKLFRRLRHSNINNRRTRRVVAEWLEQRDLAFDAVKYRGLLRSVARWSHARLPDEVFAFLNRGPTHQKSWSIEIFDVVRRARFDQSAIYELPFTIAEGIAASRGIDRERFLMRARESMTAGERARLDARVLAAGGEGADLGRVPITRLCVRVLSVPPREREPFRDALRQSAWRVVRDGLGLPHRVHSILDDSFSTRGGRSNTNRTLAVTLGIHQILEAADIEHTPHWTSGCRDALQVTPRGQTCLAEPLITALEACPDLILVVSDGFENDPFGAVEQIVDLHRQHRVPIPIVHLNPVFDADAFMPRPLGPTIPTVGIRDAADLPLKLSFARFASGSTGLEALEAWLVHRNRRWTE